MKTTLAALERRVVACRRCPELRAYCAEIGRVKKREHRARDYWARPVPAFGDPRARLLIVGLAPGAHGSNRTGRPFTGDASGVWLYRALHRAGLSERAESRARDDGLVLRDVLITAALRCAPPGNKPTPQQLRRCSEYLDVELSLVLELRVVLGLGAIGTRAAAEALRRAGYRLEGPLRFGHGLEAVAKGPKGRRDVVLLASYHPSRQNTNTGVLTEAMFDAIFARTKVLLNEQVAVPKTRKRKLG
jgi:uracil-DNA glycosylase family 4